MMMRTVFVLGVCFVASAAFGADQGQEKEAPVEELFNGVDLTGWDGDPSFWSVRDGMIVGKTTAEAPLPYNKFLIFEGEPLENFTLSAKVRVIGDNNSGIQYRSKLLPEIGDHVVGGYQCDIHPTAENHGMLYEEKGRGILAKRGMVVVVTPEGEALKIADTETGEDPAWGEWHTYRIRAVGNRLSHEVDGKVTMTIADHDEAGRALSGLLAFQIHQGNPMEVQIKDVRIVRIAPGGMIKPEATPVPKDAVPVMPPKKAKGKK